MIRYFVFTSLTTFSLCGQILDDFSDGNFTENPTWYGSHQDFEITSDKELHLNAASENASSFLMLKNNLIENTSWEISLKLKFNPSSSNYLDWFLLTNDSIDKSQSNGYFVRVGDVEDDVSLWRKQNQELTKIIDGLNDRVDVNPVDIRIKAERLYGEIGHYG